MHIHYTVHATVSLWPLLDRQLRDSAVILFPPVKAGHLPPVCLSYALFEDRHRKVKTYYVLFVDKKDEFHNK